MQRILQIFILALFVIGSLFLISTQKATAGFSQLPYCCEFDGSCADSLSAPPDSVLLCLDGTQQDNAFCNEDTGQCEPIPLKSNNIPTLSEWGLIAMAGILGIAGFMVIRRRKKATA